jgi:alkylation response protein AidB-like acyl-CoA dehydrogenase
VAIEVVAPALLAHASPEQLERWLPPMAPAEDVWCQLFSEPDAGSDLASLATRATRNGDDWLVTGQKVWCTWGQFARRGLLLARTGSPESRHRGITAFVLDMAAPGVEVRPLRTMTGVSEFAEVFLDGASIPDIDRVGPEGGGWGVALAMLAAERGTYAVRRASVIRAALGEVLARARSCPISARARAAVLRATIELHLLDLNIGALVQAMGTPGAVAPDAAITKTSLTRAEQAVFAGAQEVLGLDGLAWAGGQPPVVESYLYSRAASIYGGSSQIQRNVIGERLLGLPREPA